MRAISPNGPDVEFLKMAVRMPDALTTPVEEVDEQEFAQIEEQLVLALKQLQAFRSSEGAILQKDFELRIRNIQQLLTQVEALDTERLAAIRSRMERAVEEIRDRVDENRFEQELIFYLEKLDITEEKVRLANHLNYFLTTLEEPQSNGRKLGFIAQEIGREINTLGSKANHAQMQQIVVLMKNELEKIKEQVLNILWYWQVMSDEWLIPIVVFVTRHLSLVIKRCRLLWVFRCFRPVGVRQSDAGYLHS